MRELVMGSVTQSPVQDRDEGLELQREDHVITSDTWPEKIISVENNLSIKYQSKYLLCFTEYYTLLKIILLRWRDREAQNVGCFHLGVGKPNIKDLK